MDQKDLFIEFNQRALSSYKLDEIFQTNKNMPSCIKKLHTQHGVRTLQGGVRTLHEHIFLII